MIINYDIMPSANNGDNQRASIMRGKTAELRAMLAQLEVGRTELIHGANGGTIRTLLHKLYGAGSYVVRTAPDGAHAVTLIRGASNAVRAGLGAPQEHAMVRTAADLMAGVLARNKAKADGEL